MDYLVNHAIKNVWCAPGQDDQYRLRPKRLSQNGGEYIKLSLDWLEVYLPDGKSYWHVYQIGQLHPFTLGLFPVEKTWVSLTDVCNKMGMIAEAYTDKGVMLPKFETYYMVTKAKNLIIATKVENDKLNVDYNNEDLFFRVYTNAYFQSPRSSALTERIVTKGKSPAIMGDILAMQTEFNTYRAKTVGYAYAIINGYYYEEISPITCKIGDLVEWVYDSSVSKVVEFPISGLPDFDSVLDSERKYLLHYADPMARIEYQDDVEIFLVQRPPTGKSNGLYHHKNTAAALRNVTHKDYSMSVGLINAFVNGRPGWTDPQKLNVLMLIRESGYNRPLVFENSRIEEMYKLPDAEILPAMVGDNATVPVWQAGNLENAGYTKVMRSEFKDVTLALVQSAYGYNACSKILGDTPQFIYQLNGLWVADMPRGLYEDATVYEYDPDGLLMGWFHHDQGTHYTVRTSGCRLVEAISGTVDHQIDETYDAQTQPIDPNANYRMYICDKIDGQQQNNWRDVTDSGMYGIVNNVLTWVINMANYTTLVRSDKKSLGYSFTVPSKDGLIEFDLTKYTIRNGQLGMSAVDVPLGELDIFMNGRSIARFTDWIKVGSKVIVHNKKYLIDPENQDQEFAIRWTGFCKKDLSEEGIEDQGFVKYELLSRNATFNIRDDRVLRIVSDGRLFHRSELKYSETDQLYTLPNAENGVPYSIRDMIVPMRSLTLGDTYAMRDASRVIDKSVSDFLTIKLPEPTTSVPNVIAERYAVYTPFLAKILFDLIGGVIDDSGMKAQFDSDYVRKICAPYEYILAFDPTQTANLDDPNFVIIHPHHLEVEVEVDIYHYNFLSHVVQVYMKDKVVLNHFLSLKQIT